jgi:hypothetical protein
VKGDGQSPGFGLQQGLQHGVVLQGVGSEEQGGRHGCQLGEHQLYFREFARAQKILKVLGAMVANNHTLEVQGNVEVVWEIPEWGLPRWAQYSRTKQDLDLSGARIPGVKRQV